MIGRVVLCLAAAAPPVAAQAAPGSIAVGVRGGIEIHRGVFAFAGPRWRIRPYAELYLVNILRRAGRSEVTSSSG